MAKTDKAKKDILKILSVPIYAAISVVCVLLLRGAGGFWRTLPFLLVLPPLAVSFWNHKTVTVLILTVSGFVCARLDDYGTAQSVLFALGTGFLSAIGILIKRFVITARVGDGRKKISVIGAVLLAVAGLLFDAFLLGTPFAYGSAHGTAKRYYAETYKSGEVRVLYTAYTPFSHRFESTLAFTDGNTAKTARFYRDENGLFDGYRAYHEARLLSQKRDEWTKLLSEAFPDYVFTVEGVSIDTEKTLDASARAEDFENDMTFTVSFYTQFPDKQTYERVCGEMRETLMGKGTFLFEQNTSQE